MERDYGTTAVAGARAFAERARAHRDGMQAISIGIREDERQGACQGAHQDEPAALAEVVISRELTRQIARALEHAAGFAGYVPRAVRCDRAGDYAQSVRDETTSALMALKRAAMSQQEATVSATTAKLRAFHGDASVQAHYLARVQHHRDMDEIVQGAYYQRADSGRVRACAVGCVLHDPTGNHAAYETEIGVPAELAYLEDSIFESLPSDEAKEWPLNFMRAIPLGADLSRVAHLFLAWLVDGATYGVASRTTDAEIRELSLEVARRYRTGEQLDGPEAEALADRLRAARSARSAWDAWDAWDAWAARSARDARAARSARDARDARAAWDAWAARDARAARDAFVSASAAELLRLLAAAPLAVENETAATAAEA